MGSIMTANEGEPSSDYTVDPNGSISTDVTNNYSVTTLDFAFSSQLSNLTAGGFE
jgi:hypothetical protein